eukprot:gene5113-biopygen12974
MSRGGCYDQNRAGIEAI